jgi:1,4-alpha-glucan branching enzyme
MPERFGGLTREDLAEFHAGTDAECWRVLGAHVLGGPGGAGGEPGTRFAVWAPNASSVHVKGDFDGWAGQSLDRVPGTGVWAGFVGGAGDGDRFRYDVAGADGVVREKIDPFARRTESAPSNASVIDESDYAWGDEDWLRSRATWDAQGSPLAIYEVHPGSWRTGLSYADLADGLVEYVSSMGFTHVELMPVAEHPLVASWGYQVTNYFAPQARLGSPDGLRLLVDRLHQAGIGVILDWVPGHFPKDDWALGRYDGTGLFEHPDPRRGEHREWGTYVFDFGRPEVRSFLLANALYWLEQFHFDGLRVDAVASMVYLDYGRGHGGWEPNVHGGNHYLEAIDLLQEVNRQVAARVPGALMIAEESTAFPGVTKPVDDGGLGFDFKWNMGWMNDTLRYLRLDPVHRQYQHHDMTFAMIYQYTEHYILPISHDEVVHGKGSMLHKVRQDDWRQFASLRAYYSFMWAFPGKKLLFMGCDFGQRPEWDERRSLEWEVAELWGHRGLRRLVAELNALYRAHPALHALDSEPEGFTWINSHDVGANTFSWVRSDGAGEHLAAVVNFSPQPWTAHRIGLPLPGAWVEVLNSDSAAYDGTGTFANPQPVIADPEPHDGLPASATVVVPPLGAIWLRHDS